MENTKKKEKVVYIDDGRTLADMSNVSAPGFNRKPGRISAPLKEQWKTYKAAVKMMLKPMLFVVLAMVIAFAVLYILLSMA